MKIPVINDDIVKVEDKWSKEKDEDTNKENNQ